MFSHSQYPEDRKEVQEKVQEFKKLGSEDGDDHRNHETAAWFPGVRRQFPWLGAAGLFCVVVAMALSTAILCSSHNRVSKDWPYSSYPLGPNVLLNVVNQLSSLGLMLAIGQGLAIAWWRKALRGNTLEALHRDHSYSLSFLAVVTSGKNFNTIALAALMAKFAVIDSTLFQKATKASMAYKVDYQNVTVDAWIGTRWPAGTSGIPGTDGNTRILDGNFTDIIDAYNNKIGNGKVHDTENLFRGCPPGQTCTGSVDAFGFSYNCSVQVEKIDYGSFRLQNASKPALSATDNYPLWLIEFKPIWPRPSKPFTSINLTMMYVNTTKGPSRSCPGTITRRVCEIRPAVVRYPMTVLMADSKQSMNVTHLGFSNPTAKKYPFNAALDENQIDGLKVLETTDLREESHNISTVGAIAYALTNLFSSSANLTWGDDWDLALSGARAQAEFSAHSTTDIADFCDYKLDRSDRGFPDPFIELIREINNFGFVSALYLSGAPWINHNDRTGAGYLPLRFDAKVKGYVEQYETNFGFMAGALCATLVSVLCVLPVYWGFWELGRKVTLGPMEIANAFNAPIFDEAENKNHDVDTLLGEVGKRKVQYGQLLHGAPGQLGMAEPEKVVIPRKATTKPQKGDVVRGVGVGGAIGAVMVLGGAIAKGEGI